jgi:hypothetical protein
LKFVEIDKFEIAHFKSEQNLTILEEKMFNIVYFCSSLLKIEQQILDPNAGKLLA